MRFNETEGTELTNTKPEFYISFYEQLALKGFQAVAPSYDYIKKYLADICVNGNIIAHLTKADTIEPNPHAEDVEPGTIEKIQQIMKETATRFGISIGERPQFTDDELSMLHAYLFRARLMLDSNLNGQEVKEFDALIEKIESIVPELANLDVMDFEFSNDAEQGVEH